CAEGAVKRPERTISSASGAISECYAAEKQGWGACHVNSASTSNLPNLHTLPRLSYLGLMSTAVPLRQPIPVARSILWSPAGEDGGAQDRGTSPFPAFLPSPGLMPFPGTAAPRRDPGRAARGFLSVHRDGCPD